MAPHLDVDLAGVVRHGSGEGGVRVAVDIVAGAGATVFPPEGEIGVGVPAAAQMAVGHERGALGEGELGWTRIGAVAVRVGTPAGVDAGGVPTVVGVARVEVVTDLVHELEKGRRTCMWTHANRYDELHCGYRYIFDHAGYRAHTPPTGIELTTIMSQTRALPMPR